MIRITPDPIERVLRELPEPWTEGATTQTGSTRRRGDWEGPVGGWLDFYGIVRGIEAATPITGIEYEAHREMAEHQIERILDQLAGKYPLEGMLVVHRIGFVPVGEPSLLVRVLSPHRGEALRACAEFIDELKTWVPIWKHPSPVR